ncbi:hypothetical protein [Ignavibacterium sp.]|uniref:hypothetical protein n=1 Tax=Ignavibacterium sp. TaxID=2651167 RepID=UPI00220058D8|nr:hypothetical protein [Ignavibacterium sp.]BDQ01956.1 MAG: hypothetical protein KatS3mg037_0531 [Ignavibacterium sp.]
MGEKTTSKLNFLLLSRAFNIKDIDLVITILKSPLELALKLTNHIIDKNLEEISQDLDDIKGFSAGITSSNRFENFIAKYHGDLFKFQQYYHSSYRARQGKVIENLLAEVLRENEILVADTAAGARQILSVNYKNDIGKTDVDILGLKNNKILIIQLRSRDDTGGTTAKASLVKLLKILLEQPNIIDSGLEILYLIHIFNSDSELQKQSLIDNIAEYLNIVNKKEFNSDIVASGYSFSQKKILLKLSYGHKQFADTVGNFFSIKSNNLIDSINKNIELLSSWDDLWTSYVVASFELKNIVEKGSSSFDYLKTILNSLKSSSEKVQLNYNSIEELQGSINLIKTKVIENWKDSDLIPVRSPADQSFYIELLLYLYAINSIKNKISID